MSLKIKGKDGEWVDPQAMSISLLDLEGNFSSDNVEGALREIAQNISSNSDIEEIKVQVLKNKTSIDKHSSKISKLEEDVEALKENGGGGGSLPTITSTFTDCSIDKGEDVTVPIFFSSPSGGAGTAYIVINNIEVDYIGVKQGNNNLKIFGHLFDKTDNKLSIYVKDRAGIVSNQLEWNIISGGITLSTTFDYDSDYGITDKIRMPYSIETGVQGDIVLNLAVDGIEHVVPSKKGHNEFELSSLSLGLGTHSVSMSATVGKYTSNVITFNLVIVSTSELYLSSSFVSGSEFLYGVPISINYRLSKISTEEYTVYLMIDGVISKTQVLPVGSYYWTINNLSVGDHVITIRAVSKDLSEDVSINLNVVVIAGEYKPVEDYSYGLLCDLNAFGRDNNDVDLNIWEDKSGNNNNAKLVNFNFATNGFINNELVCDNDAYVVIEWSPWAENVINGSTIDIIYTPINSGVEECRILDYTKIIDDLSTDIIKPFKGVFADINGAIVSSASSGSSSGKISLDDESGEVHLTWVIDRDNKFCKTYINGVISRIMYLTDDGSGVNKFYEDFSHDNYIYLNSTKGKLCGTNNIKRFRVYNHAITSENVLQNHLANIRDLAKQEELYNFNYNNQTLPKMKLFGDTTNMTDKQSVDMRIEYLSPNEEKFGQSFNTGIQNNPVKIQGTSSLAYVRKNYTIFLKDEYGLDMDYNPYGNGSVAETVFCLKCDYIESSHANNTGLAKLVNDCVYDTKLPTQLDNPNCRTAINGFPIELYLNGEYMGIYNFNHDRFSTKSFGYDYKKFPNMLVYEINSNSNVSAGAFYRYGDNAESSANITERDYYARDFKLIYGNRTESQDTYSEIKSLVEWVSVAEQDLFREAISEHFNKEFLFRYLLTVLMIGGVDSLGKNLKINSFDGKIWYPTFYDLDTTLGIDNSGYLTIAPDVEIEEGSFNTSNSNLWSKVLNFFSTELKQEWSLMRQKKFTLDNIMKYVYEEQISKIPTKHYNEDAQVKYLQFGSLYTYCCHGSKEHLVKRWVRERIAYVDSMLEFFTSQDDQVIIRMNKTGNVEFSITPYIPLYFSVKWSNAQNGVQTQKLKRGERFTYSYNSTTSTDQEVIIYHAKHIKAIEDLSNLRPSSCILANAKKLTSIKINSDLLYNINVTNNTFLRSIDLSGCSALGTVIGTGSTLDLSRCNYLSYINTYGTSLTGIVLNTSGGSLKEIFYPKTIQTVSLIRQRLLEFVGLPYGVRGEDIPTSLYNIDIRDCPSISKLNTSTNDSISSSMASMIYCNNLTLRNSINIQRLSFNGFYRLENVVLENMFNLISLGFDNMLPQGQSSTVKYVEVSNCPLLTNITMNCTGNEFEISLANNAILNFGKANGLKNISSNCVVKGLKTLIIPKSIDSLFFTNEYGEGFSTLENIWSSDVCSVNTDGNVPSATHITPGYSGIDFKGLRLKNIDLGALVNIRNAINFSLSPTNVNPNFNKNRDGVTFPYLKPVGTLDLSNYTESLNSFFNGVNLDDLVIICEKDLSQQDLSYCFYNSYFSSDAMIYPLTSRVNNVTNLDYCFAGTNISNISVLDQIRTSENTSMNYTFSSCKNIYVLEDVLIKGASCTHMFLDCQNLSVVRNITIRASSINAMFKNNTRLSSVLNVNIEDSLDLSNLFYGCSSLTNVITSLPSSAKNISSMYERCYGLVNIDCTKWNLSGTNGLIKVFCECTSLVNAIFKGANLETKSFNNAFNGCRSLAKVDMSSTTFGIKAGQGNSETDFRDMFLGAGADRMHIVFDSCVMPVWNNATLNQMFKGILNKFKVSIDSANISTISDFTGTFKGTKLYEFSCNNTVWKSSDVIMNQMFSESFVIRDIAFPVSVKDVSSAYKDCKSLTSITKNWDTKYIGVINPSECYAGCTSINLIDGIKDSLNGVPKEWGGNGFELDYTNIFDVDTKYMSSRTFEFIKDDSVAPFKKNGYFSTDWGDGTVDDKRSHTYASEGVYTIKTHLKINHSVYSAPSKDAVINITQIGHKFDTGLYFCARLSNLTSFVVDYFPIGSSGKIDSFFMKCSKLEEVRVNIGTISPYNAVIINSEKMFDGCTVLDDFSFLDKMDLSNVTHINAMFKDCKNYNFAPLVNSFNLQNVLYMSEFIMGCEKTEGVIDLSEWDLRKVKSCYSTFAYLPLITEVRGLESLVNSENFSGFLTASNSLKAVKGLCITDKAITLSNMFKESGINILENVEEWNVSNVTNIMGLFTKSHIRRLDLSKWNTSNIETITSAWVGFTESMPELEFLNVSGWDLRKVSDFAYTFSRCPRLKEIRGIGDLDVTYLKNLYSILCQNDSLDNLDLSNWDITNVYGEDLWTGLGNFLRSCNSLVNFKSPKNIKTNWDLYGTTNLSQESLLSIINNLIDVGERRTLTIGSKNLAKLTPSQIKIATDKGWVVN